MSRTPLKYTSRDYDSILTDFNSDNDLKSKAEWTKRLMAGVGDMLSRCIDGAANDLYPDSAWTRGKLQALLRLINYEMTPQLTSSGTQRFNIDPDNLPAGPISAIDLSAVRSNSVSLLKVEARSSASFSTSSEGVTLDHTTDSITVAGTYDTGDLVRIGGSVIPTGLSSTTNYYAIYIDATTIKLATSLANAYAGTVVDFTSNGTSVTVTNYALKVICYQQATQDSYVIGQGDGTEFQNFVTNHTNVLVDTMTVQTSLGNWVKQPYLVKSLSTDRHYDVRYQTDGTLFFRTGNDTYGAKPVGDVTVQYAIGGGSNSNIYGVNTINLYDGNSSSILNTSNVTDFTSGDNNQSMDTARVIGPQLLAIKDTWYESEDGEALALQFGGMKLVKIDKNYFGALSARVVIVPSGGGTSSAGYKTSLEDYLESKTYFVSCTVIDATYVPVNVTYALKPKVGYNYADVEPYLTLGWRLLLSELTQEYLSDFTENGIESTITLLNAKWGTSFGVDDYTAISTMLNALIDRELYPKINGTLNQSDADGFLDNYVEGVDYFTFSAPTFPVSPGSGAITQAGTMTPSEIV